METSTDSEWCVTIVIKTPDMTHLYWLSTMYNTIMTTGRILHYSLLRDDIDIFRHQSALEHLDTNTIQPYKVYKYKLQACTVKGCSYSDEVRVIRESNVSLKQSFPFIGCLPNNFQSDHRVQMSHLIACRYLWRPCSRRRRAYQLAALRWWIPPPCSYFGTHHFSQMVSSPFIQLRTQH